MFNGPQVALNTLLGLTVKMIQLMDKAKQKEERRNEFLNVARELEVVDGAFEIVRYNKYYRFRDGHPIPDEITINEAFPNSGNLTDVFQRAENLYNSSPSMVKYFSGKPNNTDLIQVLREMHPGFRKESYEKVLFRANYMAVK